MSSNDFTYFPTRALDLFDFSESVINLISDFDVHAMFDTEKLANNWENEFDFRETYYSNSSNFEIDSRKKTDGFLNYKLLYTSNDFSISLSYEVFADMINGILQVTVNGLNKDSSLLSKLDEFCKATENEQSHINSSGNQPGSAPKSGQPHEASEPPKLKALKQRPVNKRARTVFRKDGQGSVVYTFSIGDDYVTIGEFDRMNNQGGGARDISFSDFIDEKYGQDFVLSYFDEETLAKVIRIVKSKM